MNIKSYIMLAAVTMGMAGCSESFLEVTSKTESTTDNFYKTEDDAYRALIGCYDGWQCTVSNSGVKFYILSEMMADECFAGLGTSDASNYDIIDQFDMSCAPSYTSLLESDWKAYYYAIQRCNSLISREDQIAWDEASGLRQLYMGEARAIRAILYFEMVRLWGNIPLLTEPSSENLPQSSYQDVYALIIEDLKYAAQNIPATAYPKAEAAQNDGHITCYAAKALLARVYLYYNGYYGSEPAGLTKAEALQACEDVIRSGEFALVPEFKDLWAPAAATTSYAEDGNGYPLANTDETTYTTYAGRGNSETILAQKFNYTQDYNGNYDGNEWLVMLGMRNSLNVVPYGQGWGACPVNPTLVNAFRSGDTRKAASIIDYTGEGISSADGFDDMIKDSREYTGYAIKKYTTMSMLVDGTAKTTMTGLGNGDFMISQDMDFVYVRYADVLLMAAELGSGNAQDYFDQVRQRAYTSDGVLSSSYVQLECTTANIWSERRLEFCFEAQRYWDLLRQGIQTAAQTIAVSNQHVLTSGNDDYITIQAENIISKQGLCQIPHNQITLSNNVLVQNPGW